MQKLSRSLRAQQLSQLQTLLSSGSRPSSRLASGSCCSTSYSSSASSLQTTQQYDYRCMLFTLLLSACKLFSLLLTMCYHCLIRHSSTLWLLPAALAVTAFGIDTAKADEVATIHPEEKVSIWPHSRQHMAAMHLCQRAVVCLLQSWQLLPLSTRQRTFFKYEKRIRDLSGPDKIFEYFATETKDDGSRSALTTLPV